MSIHSVRVAKASNINKIDMEHNNDEENDEQSKLHIAMLEMANLDQG